MSSIKAAIYVRVSTANQVEKGVGLDVQIDKCRQECKNKGYEIFKEYRDEGVSGTIHAKKRPGFLKLLEDAKDKQFEAIVFYRFDRLAREIRVFLKIIDYLRDEGLKIISCVENIDTSTNNGNFMLNIYATVADLELNTIKSRLSEGKEKKKSITGYVGGKLPFGYKAINKKVVKDETKSEIVQEIFECYDNLKMSLNAIARHMNQMNTISPSRSGQWYAKTISRIIANREKYEGSLMNNNVNGIMWPTILKK